MKEDRRCCGDGSSVELNVDADKIEREQEMEIEFLYHCSQYTTEKDRREKIEGGREVCSEEDDE